MKEAQTEHHSPIDKMQESIPGGELKTVNVISVFERTKALRSLFVNDFALAEKMQADVITETKDDEATDKKAIILRTFHELRLYSEAHTALFDT